MKAETVKLQSTQRWDAPNRLDLDWGALYEKGDLRRTISGVAAILEHKEQSATIEAINPISWAGFDALFSAIAVLDQHGRIVAVNRAWREFAKAKLLTENEYSVGTEYAVLMARLMPPSAADYGAIKIRSVEPRSNSFSQLMRLLSESVCTLADG